MASLVELAGTDSASVSATASLSTSQTVVSSNVSRRGLSLYNSDTNDCYVKFGATASTTDFTVKIAGGGYYEMPNPIYKGRIDAIWSADGAGSLHVTELT